MKFGVNYQYLAKGGARPRDDGATVDFPHDGDEFALLPNVGDFVSIDNTGSHGTISFAGRVKSRLFRHIINEGLQICQINIVVEETDDDWSLLIKE
jgi:hypothetical protein